MADENFGPISGGVTVTIDGKDYVIKAPSIETRGVLRNTLTTIRNTRMLSAILALEGELPTKQYERLYRDAISATGKQLGEQDYIEAIGSTEGVVASLWLLFEESYPGKVSKSQIKQLLENDTISDVKATELFTLYGVASGSVGNSSGPKAGQNSSQDQP
jgi:hypothetical protein